MRLLISKTELYYLISNILENINNIKEISTAAGVAGYTAPIYNNTNIINTKPKRKKKKKI